MTRDAHGNWFSLTVRSDYLASTAPRHRRHRHRQHACEDYLHDHQGRTFGAPGLTAQTVSSENGHEQLRGKERPG